MNYLAADTTQNKGNQGFRVTFVCRIPEALRSGNTGCGAVVGIMHYNRMSQASNASRHNCSVLAAVDEDAMMMEPENFHSGASTPVMVSRVSLTSPEVAAMTPMDHDDVNRRENAFEVGRRLAMSQDSSWVLMASPSRSTPASVRQTTSCGTDMCTLDDAASSHDEERVERESNPTSTPEHAAAGGNITVVELEDLLLLHRSPPSVASRITVGIMGPRGKLLKPIQR